MPRGRLIVLEGAHGAGKSTQAALLAEHLESRGRSCLVSEDGRGTSICDAVRALAWEHGHLLKRDPLAAAMAWALARRSRLSEVIAPALESGVDVISVRWSATTIVYQSVRGAPPAALDLVARHSGAGLTPILSLLLDLPAEVALSRCAARPGSSPWDPGSVEEAAAVRDAYLRIASREAMVVIDGHASVPEVHGRIVETTARVLGGSSAAFAREAGSAAAPPA
jgi:dTMP kinase